VVSDASFKALFLVAMRFVGGVKTYDNTLFDIAYFIFPGALLGYFIWKYQLFKHYREFLKKYLFVILWLLSIVFVWAFSFILPVISPKRVLFALPAFYLFIGLLLQYAPKKVGVGISIVLLVYQIVGMSLYWTIPSLQREDWRSVISYIERAYSPSETVILFAEYSPFAPWEYYSKKNNLSFRTISTAPQHVVTKSSLEKLGPEIVKYRTVLVFDYLRDLTDPGKYTEQWLLSQGYVAKDMIDGRKIGFIRVFQKDKLYASIETGN
jgi:hypothetical protein